MSVSSLRRGVSYTNFGYHYVRIELQQLDKKCADEEEEKKRRLQPPQK